jgi:hypothetical protein
VASAIVFSVSGGALEGLWARGVGGGRTDRKSQKETQIETSYAGRG